MKKIAVAALVALSAVAANAEVATRNVPANEVFSAADRTRLNIATANVTVGEDIKAAAADVFTARDRAALGVAADQTVSVTSFDYGVNTLPAHPTR